MDHYNVAHALVQMAAQFPFRPAIIFPAGRDRQGYARYTQLSFQQLNELCDRYAHGLHAYGIQKGERTLMMIRPGIDLIAVAFALLKIGAVPILIDPGMGRKAFLQCVAETKPTSFIGVPAAHVIRFLFPRAFRTITKHVCVGGDWFFRKGNLNRICPNPSKPFPTAQTTVEDEAAVAFTSGSTGIPKGVVYLHGMFKAQIDILQNEMNVAPGEVHLAAVYIFALFNPALGVTTVIPDMDPTKTAQVNPALLVEAIQTHGVTMSLGSPTIWTKVGDYCVANNIKLPSMKHVFMFGASVPSALVEQFVTLLDNGKVYTPFGATEALPLTMIDGKEIADQTALLTAKGAGVCVGSPIKGITIRIIPITDDPVPAWDEELVLPPGEIGEIVVNGPVVTRLYLNRPDQTALSKIYTQDGGIFHRMGDVGYLDTHNRLWICGRKSHRVQTSTGVLFPDQCEPIFNQHPQVMRTALVGIGNPGSQQPVLVAQMRPEHVLTSENKNRIIAELLELGAAFDHTKQIQTVLFHPSFPVDIRHNSKIKRQQLALWAQGRLQ